MFGSPSALPLTRPGPDSRAQPRIFCSQTPQLVVHDCSMYLGLASHSPAFAQFAHSACVSSHDICSATSVRYEHVPQVAAHSLSSSSGNSPHALRFAPASSPQLGSASTQRPRNSSAAIRAP